MTRTDAHHAIRALFHHAIIGAPLGDQRAWLAALDQALAAVGEPVGTPPAALSEVTVCPRRHAGHPAVKGVETAVLAGRVAMGESSAETAADFGLDRADVLVACWYVAWYGPDRALARAWKGWLDLHWEALRFGRYDDVKDPPALPAKKGRAA